MAVDAQRIVRNLSIVRSRIDAACRRASRNPYGVLLVAVTKTVGLEEVEVLAGAGVRDFGENRVSELVRKADAFAADRGFRWHMIGHLQRNKVRKLLPSSVIIHSVESHELVAELSRRAEESGLVVECLIEVNIADEPQKYGVKPKEAAALAEAIVLAPALKLRGLMTMAPSSPTQSSPVPTLPRCASSPAGLRQLFPPARWTTSPWA